VGDFSGIDKSTASRIVYKVSRAIGKLCSTFIAMTTTEEEIKESSVAFYKIARFSKCIGALDCTHIKISSPGGNEPEVYRNRKNFFPLMYNVSVMLIANFLTSFVGGQDLLTTGYVLVGDIGYVIKPYLITPLGNPVTAGEQLFNESQIRTRNPIERTFGIWKRRFPILSFGIRLKLEKVEAIVVATAVLHNIAKMANEEMPPEEQIEEEAVELANNVEVP
ncbi:hypothetical protein D910_02088, partial [Dendroctonus ponderosae]